MSAPMRSVVDDSDYAPPVPYSMSPVPASVAVRADAVPAPPGYTSPRSRARWALGLLGLTIAVQMFTLFALGAQRSLLNRGVGQITLSEWHTSTSRLSDLAVVEIIVLVLTGIAFLTWLHRCYVNLNKLGMQDLRFTPGWAVGYWFIPILNLFRPKQILDELWRATSPFDGGEAQKTALTVFWLVAVLFAGLTARIAAGAGAGSIGDLKQANTWLIVSSLTDIAAAAFAYRLVSSLTARQEQRVT